MQLMEKQKRIIQHQIRMILRKRKSNSDLFGIQIFRNIREFFNKQPKNQEKRLNLTLKQSGEKKILYNGHLNLSQKLKQQQKVRLQTSITYGIQYNRGSNCNQKIVDSFKLLKQYYRSSKQNIQHNIKNLQTQTNQQNLIKLQRAGLQNQYIKKVKQYIEGQFQQYKKKFYEHINKLKYMEEQMTKRPYQQVEEQILQEWRSNPLLYYIRAYWYQYLQSLILVMVAKRPLRPKQKTNYEKVRQIFEQQLHRFQQVVGQLLYLYFSRFFHKKSEQTQQKILLKLSTQTSLQITTHSSTWLRLYEKHVAKIIRETRTSSMIDMAVRQNDWDMRSYDLGGLAVEDLGLEIDGNLLGEGCRGVIGLGRGNRVGDYIWRFIDENKLGCKIKELKRIRQVIQQQILQRQQQLIKQNKYKHLKVMDKDDFIDYLVFNIVNLMVQQVNSNKDHKYSILSKLSTSIKYLYVMLGDSMNAILSKEKCQVHLTDLEVAYTYVVNRFNQIASAKSIPTSSSSKESIPLTFNQNTISKKSQPICKSLENILIQVNQKTQVN